MSALTAWRRWQQAAGPWRGYAICPVLQVGATAPKSSRARPAAVSSLDEVFSDRPTAVVVDLDPIVGVIWAANVSRERRAHVVLVLPRWPHADSVLACGELVATLEATSPWLQPVSAPNVVFILDGDRARTIAPRPTADQRVDNRYDLSAGDLPNLHTLRAAGIQRVLKLTRPSP